MSESFTRKERETTSSTEKQKERLKYSLLPKRVIDYRAYSTRDYLFNRYQHPKKMAKGYATIPEYDDMNVDDVLGPEGRKLSSFFRFSLIMTIACVAGFAVVAVTSQMQNSFGLSFGLINLDETTFTLTSPAFENDGNFPEAYTCKLGTETGVSPPLAWSNPPAGTVDYLITMKKESGYSW